MNENHQDRSPQEKVCGYEYTVRRGDSFYLIANRLGVPLRDLLEANSEINPARLMVGDVLCIPMEEDDAPPSQPVPEAPTLPEPPLVPEAPVTPEVPSAPETPESPTLPEGTGSQPDETLPDMDDALDVPAQDGSTCPQGNRYAVAQGETAADVQLRANINRYTLQSANPTTDLDALRTGQVLCVPTQNAACPAASTYTLQAEDTLESAALRLNTSLAALLRANPCLAPGDFTPGRCIFLPE